MAGRHGGDEDGAARDDARRPADGGVALGRRLLVLRVSAAALAVPAAALAGAGEATAQGAQISPYRPPPQQRRYRSGITDGDPSDQPGNGRGRRYYSAPRRVTDNDPSDGAGRGRGYYNPRRVTDSDPTDSPGRGRGY